MKIARRSFITRVAATTALSPFILPSRIRAAETAPNGLVNIAFIGMGLQNRALLTSSLWSKVKVVAVCDVDTSRREHALRMVADCFRHCTRLGVPRSRISPRVESTTNPTIGCLAPPVRADGCISVLKIRPRRRRQILVTAVDNDSPADGIARVNDEILCVFGKPFTDDDRRRFGHAIATAGEETDIPDHLNALALLATDGANYHEQMTDEENSSV